jgi:non-homologous end joining protein Ku
MLDLALHIVESKRGEFEPGKFEDENRHSGSCRGRSSRAK